MPALGLNSGNRYLDEEILNPERYVEMSSEPLCFVDDKDCLVLPVRRRDAPHFRSLTEKRKTTRIGRSENDPSHEDCIAWVMKSLFDPESSKKRNLRLATNVFDDEGKREQQVIFKGLPSSEYRWWREGRIAFCDGRYIQPDICGRDIGTFAPGVQNRSVIIEVIQTHYPEEETFFRLLQLSAQNHIVVFYFIAPEKRSTEFSRYDLNEAELTLIPRYYLLDGEFFKNDTPIIKGRKLDSTLYQELQAKHFDVVMAKKK